MEEDISAPDPSVSQVLQKLAQPCCTGSGLDPPPCWPLSSSPHARASLCWPQGQGSICSARLVWEAGPPGGTSLHCPGCLRTPGSADPCTWVRMDLISLVWGAHLPAKEHEAGAEETLPVQRGSPGSPAMKGPGFTAEAAPCFSRGCSHAGLVQKLLRMACEILGMSSLNLRS